MTIISNNSFRNDEKKRKMTPEDIKGEESAAGSMPDPESDDDVTDLEHESGLYLKEDTENPQEADFLDQEEEVEES